MTTETDAEFVNRLMKGWARHDEVWAGDAPRLFALARRGEVIKTLEAEILRLRTMVKHAYNSGFKEGMREVTSSQGGIPWSECRFRKDVEP